MQWQGLERYLRLGIAYECCAIKKKLEKKKRKEK